ncbi:MAG: choice-of-anchor Q domain-containing protein [Chitinophagaceae bacterium]
MRKLLLLSFILGLFYSANATVPTVLNNNDAGPGSLRQAILNANAGTGTNFITFDIPVTGVITLTSGELALTSEMTIMGPGTGTLAVSGNNISRVFSISSPALVTINGLTITGGNVPGNGGGISSNGAGGLSINGCTVSGNTAGGPNVSGGGIFSFAPLTITNSVINGNHSFSGGGIFQGNYQFTMTNCKVINNTTSSWGAGLYLQDADATLFNCLISGNSSPASQGGITNLSYGANPVVSLVNCTVTNNISGFADRAVWTVSFQNGTQPTTVLRNTIVANNPGGNFTVINGFSPSSPQGILDLGNSLDDDGSSGVANGVNGNLVNINPSFVSASNFHLQPCSPCINAGTNSANPTTTDLDGSPRKFGIIDMGAYELQATPVALTTLYVNAAVTSSGAGSTWATAYKTLQEALANNCASVTKIWVAKGNYYPDEGGSFANNDRGAAFTLKNGVAIYGGFAGNEASNYDLSLRNFVTNETILSGDLDKNDGAGFANNSGNAYHVIHNNGNGLTNTAVLDGFTIKGGNANGADPDNAGAGMRNTGSAPAISKCTFTGNAAELGGAIWNDVSNPQLTLTSCTISGNKASTSGAGIQTSGTLNIAGSSISGNTALGSNGGGGIYSFASLTLSNSTISGNTAALGAGLLQIDFPLTMTSCKVSNNTSSSWGAGMFLQNANGTLTNCLINGNSSPTSQGGISNFSVGANTLVNLVNCTVAGNTSGGGYRAVWTVNYGGSAGATTNLVNTIVAKNTGGNFLMANLQFAAPQGNLQSGGNNLDDDGTSGFTNGVNGDIVFVDPLFVGGFDYHLQPCSPAVNVGNDAANATATDLDMLTRKVGVIDLGAYEQQTGGPVLASANRNATSSILAGGTVQFLQNCELIARLQSNGAAPQVSGDVTAKVWIEPTQPSYNGRPYLRRHYEITPATNAANATGTITLYFTQQEFDDFNAFPNNGPDLPTNKNDIAGIQNFAIYKYSGASNNGTGLPGTYPQPGVLLKAPAVTLTWNDVKQWWEASFATTGFSGFFGGNIDYTILPIADLLNFNVVKQGMGSAINWQVSAAHTVNLFTVEKSYNGRVFTPLQTVNGKKEITSYNAVDPTLQSGLQYYRLMLLEKDGSIGYSAVKTLLVNRNQVMVVAPNPTKGRFIIDLQVEGQLNTMAEIQLQDISGKIIYTQQASMNAGVLNQAVNMPASAASGMYQVRIIINGKTYHTKLLFEK